MCYELIVRRIANMLAYDMTRNEIRDKLLAEGVGEEIILFAYVGAKMRQQWA